MASRCEQRPKRSSARRAVAAALAMCAVLAACSGNTYGEDSGLSDVGKNIKRNKPAKTPKPKGGAAKADPTAVPTTRGIIVIKVLDQRRRPRPLVMVKFTSPAQTKAILVETDAKGLARVHATTGTWKAEIPTGCVGNSHVTFGGNASKIGVAAGQTTTGVLNVRATRRYMPGPPLKWEQEPPWPLFEEVNASVRLRDVCTDEPAPDIDFEGHMLAEHVGPVHIPRFETRSDGSGWIRIGLLCDRRDEGGSVWFYDRWNESDRVDILAFTPPIDPNASWCSSSGPR